MKRGGKIGSIGVPAKSGPIFPPQLFDLESDPGELVDLGARSGMAAVRTELDARLFRWLRRLNYRVTAPDARVASWTETSEAGGLKLGVW